MGSCMITIVPQRESKISQLYPMSQTLSWVYCTHNIKLTKQAILAHGTERATMDFGNIFLPRQIFLCPLCKIYSFLASQICPGSIFPPHLTLHRLKNMQFQSADESFFLNGRAHHSYSYTRMSKVKATILCIRSSIESSIG